jgi:hypothetical protein
MIAAHNASRACGERIVRDCPARKADAPMMVAAAFAAERVRRAPSARSSENVSPKPTDVATSAIEATTGYTRQAPVSPSRINPLAIGATSSSQLNTTENATDTSRTASTRRGGTGEDSSQPRSACPSSTSVARCTAWAIISAPVSAITTLTDSSGSLIGIRIRSRSSEEANTSPSN